METIVEGPEPSPQPPAEPPLASEPPSEPVPEPPPEPSPEPSPEPAPPEPSPEPPAEPAAGEESQDPDPVEETAAEDPPELPGPGDEGVEIRGTLEFADCGRPYLCATLAVPADHDDPDGPTIHLAVGMIPAGDAPHFGGYLLTNPGGPGGGMEGFLDLDAGLSPYLMESFDVISWDPRGVGGSVPSGCWVEAVELHLLDPLPDSPAEQEALDAAARALAEECVATLGDLVGHVGTIDTVRDMEAIRRALGAETISYIGFSYGTLLGLLYADRFGEHLRAAVLDGVVDPSLSTLERAVRQMVSLNRSLEAMFAWCRSEPACAVTGDPAETYYGLLQQVDENPLTDAAGGVVLGPARTILAATFATYSSTLWPLFFQFLADAAEGDGTMLGRVGEAFTALADLGAFVSINCTDDGAVTRRQLDSLAEALEEAAGVLWRASLVSALPCEYWPISTGTRPVGPVAAPEAPPILVVGNRGDNATPYEWAVSVAEQLESGVLVSYDGNDHGSYGLSRCVTGVVDEYLVNLIVPSGEVDCPAEN